jgi:hypothetical protein
MKIKATVYDTNNIDNSPRKIIVRNVYCDKNGKPQRIGSQNGLQYKDFELTIEDHA